MIDESMRKELVELLDSLGSDEDDEVLQAGRQLHARITDADLSWDDLLVAGGSGDGSDSRAADADGPDGGPKTEANPSDEESLSLIADLLALPDCSEDLREELAGYKADIGRNELDDADRRYVGALHKRLARSR